MATAFSVRKRQAYAAHTEYFDIMPRGYHALRPEKGATHHFGQCLRQQSPIYKLTFCNQSLASTHHYSQDMPLG
jgi:hypothetical protein